MFFWKSRNITDYFLKRTRCLKKKPECTPGRQEYSMFTEGGVEAEVGEFLYAFVKMVKPSRILETGTHHGISAMYMGQALRENQKGHLTTLDIFQETIDKARTLWREVGVAARIRAVREHSLKYETQETFDMLFLDSEPDIRFDELVKFYNHLIPGGFVFIHDLHPHLGLEGLKLNGMENWPYGDFRKKFGHLIQDHSLQTFTFRTPRGLTIFQKTDADFGHTNFLREKHFAAGASRSNLPM